MRSGVVGYEELGAAGDKELGVAGDKVRGSSSRSPASPVPHSGAGVTAVPPGQAQRTGCPHPEGCDRPPSRSRSR